MILFLDFDGVLHPEGEGHLPSDGTEFCFLPRLEALLTMTSVNGSNPLSNMMDNAFSKFDQDKDGRLNAQEFRSLYEIMKPGIATNKDGELQISENEYRQRMDANGDGGITREEMHETPMLMPADLTDESLGPMLEYLLKLKTDAAVAAAGVLSADDELTSPVKDAPKAV